MYNTDKDKNLGTNMKTDSANCRIEGKVPRVLKNLLYIGLGMIIALVACYAGLIYIYNRLTQALTFEETLKDVLAKMESTVSSETADSSDTYTKEGVLMRVNGVEFTYSDVEDALAEYEKAALLELATLYVQDMYFGAYELTDAEFEKQVTALQGDLSEEEWQSYLTYNNLTLDDLRSNMEYSAQYQIKVDEKLAEITYTESDALEFYEENPEYYQSCEMDLLYVTAPEAAEVLKKDIESMITDAERCESYYSLNKTEGLISDYMVRQKVSILTEDFGVDLRTSEVGDILTASHEDMIVIGIVRDVNMDFDSVKTDIIENEKIEMAYTQIDEELKELFNTVDFELYGKQATLSSELNIE